MVNKLILRWIKPQIFDAFKATFGVLNVQRCKKKGCYPIINEYQREKIVGSIKYVDLAFREESLELKEYYCKKYNADILIMGDDHKGRFDHLKDLLDIEVLYFPRTENVSTTAIRSKITDSHI